MLKHKEPFLLILCILIGFSLRFYMFDQKSLWCDEIYTLNDSRYRIHEQLAFYQKNPNYPQAPLFFVLTHLFYPFSFPERELRILPLLFGTLSIPLFYFLARLFSPRIAIPCTFCLSFMTYHISLSQDARSYTMVLFFALGGLLFFMKHLLTRQKVYLIPASLFYSLLFYMSYSSVFFICFSQLLWFYRTDQKISPPSFGSVLLFNGLVLLFCSPWLLLLGLAFKGRTPFQWISGPFDQDLLSLWSIIYGVLHDWGTSVPLAGASFAIILLSFFFDHQRRNKLILVAILFLPIFALYALCKTTGLSHVVASRYFVGQLPLFFVLLFLSTKDIELKKVIPLKKIDVTMLFLLAFLGTNLMILPLYYCSEKQDFRGLVTFLKNHLQEGDKIYDADARLVGILYYFQVPTDGRFYRLNYYDFSKGKEEFRKTFLYKNKVFNIYYSRDCCEQYFDGTSRLWIIAGPESTEKVKHDTPATWMGYFDGSFFQGSQFPTDASMNLFLWDPKLSNEKSIDMSIE